MTTLILGALATTAPAAGDDPRLRLHVAGAGKVAQATPGSYCLSDGQQAICSDAAYPLRTTGRTSLVGGRTRRVRSGAVPKQVHLRLLANRRLSDRAVFEADLTPLDRDPRRFVLRLPKRLRCARIADVFVRYPDGDADFWAAVTVPGCSGRKARKKKR